MIDVLDGDVDADGDTLSVVGASAATFGTVSCTSTECTYTPELGYFGSDSFTYTVGDGFGGVWHIAPVGGASASQAPAASKGYTGY